MGINFPNAPSVGQLFPVPGQPGVPQWKWDGTVWGPGSAPLAQPPTVIRGQLQGLTLSTPGSSNVFGVAAGVAADSTAVDMMALANAMNKTANPWVAGSGNGALDAGTISGSATWYHVFLIKNPTTSIVDVLFSLSPTAPNLPTGYTEFRRIGSLRWTGTAWTAFVQEGDEFLWVASVADAVNLTTQSSTAVLYTLSTPLGVKTVALFSIMIDKTATNTNSSVYVSSPDQNDEAVANSGSTGPVSTSLYVQTSTEGVIAADLRKRTDINSRIRVRAYSALNTFSIQTYGWIDRRGRDA